MTTKKRKNRKRPKRKRVPKICPTHGVLLQPVNTKYGRRHNCPTPGCTVCCWDGSTSTPADDETRTLRSQCHDAFDPLWKRREHFGSRAEAYRWLCEAMGIEIQQCHFGMFDAERCRVALDAIGKLKLVEAGA